MAPERGKKKKKQSQPEEPRMKMKYTMHSTGWKNTQTHKKNNHLPSFSFLEPSFEARSADRLRTAKCENGVNLPGANCQFYKEKKKKTNSENHG